MKNRYFDNPFSGQSIVEYTVLLAMITALTLFTSHFIAQARTDAETHRDTAASLIQGPGQWPANVEPLVPYSETEGTPQ